MLIIYLKNKLFRENNTSLNKVLVVSLSLLYGHIYNYTNIQ